MTTRHILWDTKHILWDAARYQMCSFFGHCLTQKDSWRVPLGKIVQIIGCIWHSFHRSRHYFVATNLNILFTKSAKKSMRSLNPFNHHHHYSVSSAMVDRLKGLDFGKFQKQFCLVPQRGEIPHLSENVYFLVGIIRNATLLKHASWGILFSSIYFTSLPSVILS